MQITIVQTEIEAAITAFIKSQITVNDNMKINIDLRATRGTEGFQAIIDIIPSDAPVVTPKTAVQETKTAPAVKEVKEEVTEEASSEEPSKGERDIEVDEDGNPTAPAGAPRSIFAGMKKPVNAE